MAISCWAPTSNAVCAWSGQRPSDTVVGMAGDVGDRDGGRDARREGKVVEAKGTAPLPLCDMLPLCVDLDGTLVRSDTLHEQYLNALVRRPFAALLVVALLLRGKAAFKRGLNQLSPVNPESLPYQLDLLDFLRQ